MHPRLHVYTHAINIFPLARGFRQPLDLNLHVPFAPEGLFLEPKKTRIITGMLILRNSILPSLQIVLQMLALANIPLSLWAQGKV